MQTTGVPKALLPYHGEPWILRQLDTLAVAGLSVAWVVLGYHRDRFYETIPTLQMAEKREQTIHEMRVRVVVNASPEDGPYSSLLTALRHIDTDAFVLPVDVPCAHAPVWKAMADTEAEAVVPTFEGRGGHPVLLRAGAIAELLGVTSGPDARLDVQLRRLQTVRLEVEDPTILENHNEAADYDD